MRRIPRVLRKQVFGLFFAIFFVAAFFPFLAHSLSLGGVGIRASGAKDWFIFNLGPGESAEDYVEVFNYTEESQRLLIHAYDSEPSNIGAFALTGSNNIQTGIGKWVKVEQEEIEIPAGESRAVKFTITIPQDANVGEHSGAITAQTTQYKAIVGFTGAAIGTRVGARIYNTVPGDIVKKIKITDFSINENKEKKEYEIVVTAKNEGNVSVSPLARLHIEGWGLETQKKIFHTTVFDREWQLLRNAEVITYWTWPVPYFGRYAFSVTLDYEAKEGEAAREEAGKIVITIIPWRDVYILLGIFAVVALLLTFLIVYRKKKYSGKTWDEYTVLETDNVMSLAQKCRVPWKVLVKVNKIKKPYFLQAGQDILVPPGTIGKKLSQEKKTVSSAKKKTKSIKHIMTALSLVFVIALGGVILVLGILLFIRSIRESDENIIVNTEIIREEPADLADSQDEDTAQETVTADVSTTTTTQTPEEPQPALDKAQVTVQVLNGSGTAGLAGVYAQKLRDDGFSSVSTGNADKFTYQGVTIQFLEKNTAAAENIKEILKRDFANVVFTKVEAGLADVVVILGKQ